MKLLGDWAEALQAGNTGCVTPAPAIAAASVDLPRASQATAICTDEVSAAAFVDLLWRAPVAAIAMDIISVSDREPVQLRSGEMWSDIRSVTPVVVGVAAWVRGSGQGASDSVLRGVLDLRVPAVQNAWGAILRMRVPFALHDAKTALFALWSVGIDPDLFELHDTWVAAAALDLGCGHRRAQAPKRALDEVERIRVECDLDEAKAERLSVVGLCNRFSIARPTVTSRDALVARARGLTSHEPLDQQLVEFAATEAELVLRIYAAQQAEIVRAGLSSHLQTVEFPFAIANARIEWRGVHVEPERRALLRRATNNAAEHFAVVLREQGINPPGSRDAFLRCMARMGFGPSFVRDGKPCTQDDLLESLEHLTPIVGAFRLHQRYRRMAHEEWINGALTGADGRVHPAHHQLGAATGRNTCTSPNLAGIGRILRPVVTAPAGRALVEFDYCQIEVGVAAAEHHDADLIDAFNSGDVYAAMAQRFYAAELTDQQRSLSPREFKRERPEMRDAIKTFVLAVIYNIQAQALAKRFSISVAEAERQRERFLGLFPALQRGLEQAAAYGLARGSASVVTGLARQVEHRSAANGWTRNFLRNTPIQGSAAVVFKRAVIDLDREFRSSDTWIVLPVHDAVLVECATDQVDAVCAIAVRVMESAMRRFYPRLQPRVETNRLDTSCWNKDGNSDSLEKFLADPSFRLTGAINTAISVDAPVEVELGDEEEASRGTEQLDFGYEVADGRIARPELPLSRHDWPDDAREDFEERAAIREFDGGMTRGEAEALAESDIRSRYAEGGAR